MWLDRHLAGLGTVEETGAGRGRGTAGGRTGAAGGVRAAPVASSGLSHVVRGEFDPRVRAVTRISAIVTDAGANLSHASIVARELGIPAVVGCGNATTRIRTGDRIRVDGGQGTVEVLRAA
ncbi:PEP-utilizing enzyme [Streptomyces sp. NPDC000410]|uniref:PEP-utilizing enzyme n=1 Tax=Streptomyces sp. NPDC000410 TaxID=3154254 RepID=UPI0033205715